MKKWCVCCLCFIVCLGAFMCDLSRAEDNDLLLNEKVEYIGGVIERGDSEGLGVISRSIDDMITVAYALPQGALTVGEASVWRADVSGGTGEYTYEFTLFHKDFSDFGNTYTYIMDSVCQSSEPVYEIVIPMEGWYILQFRVTDTLGEYVVFQSARFSTTTDEISLLVEEVVKASTDSRMSDYEKALVLHDCLCDSAGYDDSLTVHDPAGVLLNKTGVCESFALAYHLLLDEAGVENIYVEGYGGNEAHAWNMICLDGEWYHVDVTWDEERKDRYFFGMSDELIKRSHTIRTRVPSATGMKYNWMLNNSDGSFGELDELLTLFQAISDEQETFCFYYTGCDRIQDRFYEWCQANGSAIRLVTYGCEEVDEHTLYVYGTLATIKTDVDIGLTTPNNLIAEQVGEDEIMLSWAPCEGALSYEVYASRNDESYLLLASCDKTTCTLSDLENGAWRFKIRAVNGEQRSMFSKAVSMSVGLVMPDTSMCLTLNVVSENSIYLEWEPVEGAAAYRVYCKTENGEYALLMETENVSCVAEYLEAEKTYSFRITAIHGVGSVAQESILCDESSITLEKASTTNELFFSISSGGKITAYTGAEKNVVVPQTINGIQVTSIGSSAFAGSDIESIVLPDTINTISYSAFKDCTSLKFVKLSENLEMLGSSVFSGCTALIAVHFNDNLSQVNSRVFYGCTSLRQVVFPESVTFVDLHELFYGCTSLETVTLPVMAETVNPQGTFRECAALKKVTLPRNMQTLGYAFFADCSALETVDLPEEVTCIGESAFSDCTSLKDITLPQGVTRIEYSAFRGCSALKNISIPDAVSYIGAWAFNACNQLEHISLPDSLTTVGDNAFFECSSLIEVSIPKGVATLDGGTFMNCASLQKVSLPEGLLSIGDFCFWDCFALREIVIPSTVAKMGSNVFRCDTSVAGVLDIEGPTIIRLKCDDVSFPPDLIYRYHEDAPNIFIASAGSNAYLLCERYGYLCAAPGDSIHLTGGYSTNASAPTQLPANTVSISLENEENVVFDSCALIANGRVYTFPFANNIIRPYSEIVNRFTEGDTISFLVGNDICAELVFMYRDENGVRRIAPERWYFEFGSNTLKMPELLSPIVAETSDGYAFIDCEDFRMEWISSEDAVYDVTLFEYGEWVEEEGGATNMGFSIWHAQNLEEPVCNIPREYFTPGNMYSLSITAKNLTTGDETAYSSDLFIAWAQTGAAFSLQSPFYSGAPDISQETPRTIPDRGALELYWNDEATAKEYRVRLDVCLNGSFNALGNEYVTTQTSFTIPSEEIYRSDNAEYYRLTLTAVTSSGAEISIETYFNFVDQPSFTMAVDDMQLSQIPEEKVVKQVGNHELSWTPVQNANHYRLDIYMLADEGWTMVQTLNAGNATELSYLWSNPGHYGISIYASAPDCSVTPGCYYLDIEQTADNTDQTALTILTPVNEWLHWGNLTVEWTPTVAKVYDLTLAEYRISDDGKGYFDDGWYQKTGLTETIHTIPSSMLKYNTSYRLTIKSYPEAVSMEFKVLGPEEEMPCIEGVQYSLTAYDTAENNECQMILISWPDADDIAFFETLLYNSSGDLVYSERIQNDPITISGKLLGVNDTYQMILRAYSEDMISREYRVWFSLLPNSACEHVWDNGYVTVEATCHSKGAMTYSCIYCQRERTESIPTTEHRESGPIVMTMATCTQTGVQIFVCERCSVTVREEQLPAIGHAEGDTVITKNPTCVENGAKMVQCMNCGKTIHADTIPAMGHEEEIIPGVPATCFDSGSTEGKRCSRCSITIIGQDFIPALGCQEIIVIKQPATCTAMGLQDLVCERCGRDMVIGMGIPAKGHTEVIDDAVAATFSASGLTEGKHCSVCNAVLTSQTIIPVKGHTEVTDVAVAATCTASGLTEGKHCERCGSILVEQSVIEALGHVESEKVIVTKPSVTMPGSAMICCKVCGELIRMEEIPALGIARIPGDANEDGRVDIIDALLTLQYSVGWEVEINIDNVNVNGDDAVNIMDALLILQHSVGWEVKLQ